jgi:hypothetical protein
MKDGFSMTIENDRRNDLTELNLLNIAKIQKIAKKDQACTV